MDEVLCSNADPYSVKSSVDPLPVGRYDLLASTIRIDLKMERGGPMSAEGRVVVIVQPRVGPSPEPGRYMAELRELGLVAFADSPEEAFRKLTARFVVMVRTRRVLGNLVSWLDESKLEWFWREDYNRAMPVMDADAELPVNADFRYERPMAA